MFSYVSQGGGASNQESENVCGAKHHTSRDKANIPTMTLCGYYVAFFFFFFVICTNDKICPIIFVINILV